MRESQPRAESAQHIADGCRWACEAALLRIGLTTGCVGVDPGLLLTVYLVTVSEPDGMSAVSYPPKSGATPFENGVILARLSPASVGQVCP